MGEIADSGGSPNGEGEFGRRRFILGAVVAGGLAFTAPAIVTMAPAGASTLHSPPPKPPETTGQPELPPEVSADVLDVRPAGTVAPAVDPSAGSGSQLPFTGASVKDLLAAGLTATAGGAAMVLWSADSRTGRAGSPPPPAVEPPPS